MDEVFHGRPQNVWYQRWPVDGRSPGLGVMAQDGRTKGGTLHGETDRCGESQGWTTAFSSMPNVTGRTKNRITQSKRARAGWLASGANLYPVDVFVGFQI